MESAVRRIDRRSLGFWIITAAFAGMMLLSAGMYFSGAAEVRDTLVGLGYPAYILTILGTAKLLGAIALLQNRLPTLREWAYAGFTINLLGAAASHVLAGDPVSAALTPAILLLPLAASYALRTDRAGLPLRTAGSGDRLAA